MKRWDMNVEMTMRQPENSHGILDGNGEFLATNGI